MDGSTILSMISSAMSDGSVTVGTLLVTLLALAGTVVVWAKL
jgi:hypothetical protein